MEEHPIMSVLQKEYNSGMSQVEMAKKHNISNSMMNKLFTHPGAVDSLKWSFIRRMFPNATLHLNGSDVDISTIRNLEATLANIRKIVNDDTFTPEKKLKLIQVILE